MAVENGIIVEPVLNLDNLGKSALEVLTVEINEDYRTLHELFNLYGAAILAAVNDGNYDLLLEKKTMSVNGLSMNVWECITYYQGRQTMVLNLQDCGVLPDFSNLESVVTAILGDRAPQALVNINAIAAVSAKLQAFITCLGDILTELTAQIDNAGLLT